MGRLCTSFQPSCSKVPNLGLPTRFEFGRWTSRAYVDGLTCRTKALAQPLLAGTSPDHELLPCPGNRGVKPVECRPRTSPGLCHTSLVV